MSTMDDNDPRVKALQQLAWQLQSLSGKPGGKVPEYAKKEAYRLSSKAISHVNNCSYMEEEDWLEFAASMTKEIEAKKIWVDEVENKEKAKLMGKCFRADGGGGYTVGKQENASRCLPEADASDASLGWKGVSDSRPSLSAAEIVARCEDDPEELFLCGIGLGDSDMDALCEGLRRGGSRLTCLDISCNSISDAGVQRIVAAIAGGACPKLREIFVGGNAFGPLGEKMFTSGLCAIRKGLVVHTDASKDAGGATRGGDVEAPTNCSDTVISGVERETVQELQIGREATGIGITVDPLEKGLEAAGCAAVGATEPKTSVHIAGCDAGSASEQNSMVYSVDWAGGENDLIRVTVPLLGEALSAGDLDLDASARRLVVRMRASGDTLADAALPHVIDTESAQAAFSRKRRTLTVTMRPMADLD